MRIIYNTSKNIVQYKTAKRNCVTILGIITQFLKDQLYLIFEFTS